MKPPILIPFYQNGGLCTYVGRDGSGLDWRQNFVFEDTLVYKGYAGGRSSMTMNFVSSTTGKKYPMFFCYFDALIRRDDIGPGPSFTGRWTFCKRGMNYSVMPAGGRE